LKDATPLNVLFRGPEPIFIDVLSFERRDPGDPTWLPYAQFVRTFLLPLLAVRHFGVGLDQTLLSRRDGIEPQEFYRWLRGLQKIKSPFLSLVSLPIWVSRKRQDDATIYDKRVLPNAEKAEFILQTVFRSLGGSLRRARPLQNVQSTWSDYTKTHSYSDSQFGFKEEFVQDALRATAPQRVLDVGCNTGHFSALAARAGASVVSIDYDPVVVDYL
jgi:hypothetical protein